MGTPAPETASTRGKNAVKMRQARSNESRSCPYLNRCRPHDDIIGFNTWQHLYARAMQRALHRMFGQVRQQGHAERRQLSAAQEGVLGFMCRGKNALTVGRGRQEGRKTWPLKTATRTFSGCWRLPSSLLVRGLCAAISGVIPSVGTRHQCKALASRQEKADRQELPHGLREVGQRRLPQMGDEVQRRRGLSSGWFQHTEMMPLMPAVALRF